MEFVDYYQTEQLSADLDGDGVAEPLTLGYDPAAYPETNGLHGTYVDYFLRSAEAQLETPLAFDAMNYCTENEVFGDHDADYRHWDKYCLAAMTKHYDELAAAYSESDSKYDGFAELYEDFANDCIEIVLGQSESGNVTEANIAAVLNTLAYVDGGEVSHDIVWMYNPMNLFLDGTATLPTWVWTVTGGVDSDSSNLVSMNDALALSMNGVDASFAWTWNAGHGSNTPLNTTQNGVIDAMMAKYAMDMGRQKNAVPYHPIYVCL